MARYNESEWKLNEHGEPTVDIAVDTWRDMPESIVHHCLLGGPPGIFRHARLGIRIVILDELIKHVERMAQEKAAEVSA